MNTIDTTKLEAELLKQIDVIVEKECYRDREQAIIAMLTEQAVLAVGVVTGGADVRHHLSILHAD